jgi:hypothetical protein
METPEHAAAHGRAIYDALKEAACGTDPGHIEATQAVLRRYDPADPLLGRLAQRARRAALIKLMLAEAQLAAGPFRAH